MPILDDVCAIVVETRHCGVPRRSLEMGLRIVSSSWLFPGRPQKPAFYFVGIGRIALTSPRRSGRPPSLVSAMRRAISNFSRL